MRSQEPKQTTISPALLAKTKEIEFQARATYGRVNSQLEWMLADEPLVNNLTDAVLELLTEHSDNLSEPDYIGFFKLLSFLNNVQHLQHLQAVSGSKTPIY